MPPEQRETQSYSSQKGPKRAKSPLFGTMLLVAGLAGLPTGTCIAGMARGQGSHYPLDRPAVMSAEKKLPGPCVAEERGKATESNKGKM